MLFSVPPNTRLLKPVAFARISAFCYQLWMSSRDESGKLPIHIACRSKSAVGSPGVGCPARSRDASYGRLHWCTASSRLLLWYSSVRFLVEHGVLWPLEIKKDLCHCMFCVAGSTAPSLRTVQYLWIITPTRSERRSPQQWFIGTFCHLLRTRH